MALVPYGLWGPRCRGPGCRGCGGGDSGDETWCGDRSPELSTVLLLDRSECERCCHGIGDDSESICIGGGCGDPCSDSDDESTDARIKSFTSWFSRDSEVAERPGDAMLSSTDEPRIEFIEVIRLTPYPLPLCRRMRAGPGSLSTVANEITDIELRSSDDIE